jgi:hypothetical protein
VHVDLYLLDRRQCCLKRLGVLHLLDLADSIFAALVVVKFVAWTASGDGRRHVRMILRPSLILCWYGHDLFPWWVVNMVAVGAASFSARPGTSRAVLLERLP